MDIKYLRRKGVFRYSVGWKDSVWCINKFIEIGQLYGIPDYEIEYLNGKRENKWLFYYFINTEKKICKWIDDRYKRRIRKKEGIYVYETSLTLELMVFIEMLYRFVYSGEGKIHDPSNKNEIIRYSIEDLQEGVSYLLYLCYERIPVHKDRSLWIDAFYIFSNDISELVIEATKYKILQEIEYQADCFGYRFEKCGDETSIVDMSSNDKCLRTGYAKYELQRAAKSYSIIKNMGNGESLKHISDMIYDEFKDLVFQKVYEGTTMERYVMRIPELLLEKLSLSTKDNMPGLFKEETLEICINAGELFLSNSDMLNMHITKDCTVTDLLVFKRFFCIASELKSIFLKNDVDDKKTIARSMVPVFSIKELEDYLSIVLKSRDKVKQLLNLFSYSGNGKLDILYTPIIKLSETKCYIMTEILTRSNLIPNAIVHSRHLGEQLTNSNGVEDSLENFTNELFKNANYKFNCKKGTKFKYAKKEGEIDNIIWTDSYIYLIECKNNMNPTSVYELRTTLDYIDKACSQLELSEAAFNDSTFRKKYFKGWGISDMNQTIIPFILLGNRVFSSHNVFKYPVRHVHELEQLLYSGIVTGTFGTWRTWEKKIFQESDLIKFLSEQNPLSKCFDEGMFPLKWKYTCGKVNVIYETYACSFLALSQAFDDNLEIIDKKEDERKEALEKYGNGAHSFSEYKKALFEKMGVLNDR